MNIPNVNLRSDFMLKILTILLSCISALGVDVVTVCNYIAAFVIGITLQIVACCMEIWRRLAFGQQVKHLERKHVMISGCDSGFGRLLAVRLLGKGMPVHAGCLTEAGIENLRDEAKSNSEFATNLNAFLLDVANDESVAAARRSVAQKVPLEGLWALVCNAGVLGSLTPDTWNTLEDFTNVLNVNLFGHIRTTHAFRDLLSCSGSESRLIFMCSMLSHSITPYNIPYSVSKHALKNYAECLRVELAFTNQRVITICPGMFLTALVNHEAMKLHYQSKWDKMSSEARRKYGGHTEDSLPPMIKQRKRFVRRSIKIFSIQNASVDTVIENYEHAVLSLRPKLNYWVGKDVIFIRVMKRMCVQSQLLLQMLGRKVLGDATLG